MNLLKDNKNVGGGGGGNIKDILSENITVDVCSVHLPSLKTNICTEIYFKYTIAISLSYIKTDMAIIIFQAT